MKAKLIICAIVAILFPAVASAQLITSAQTITVKEKKILSAIEPGYEQSVELYFLGITDMAFMDGDRLHFTPAFGADYIGGYRFNNTLFVGAGIGLYYDIDSSNYNDNSYTKFGNQERGLLLKSVINVPLYAHVRAYLGKGRVQPFFSASMGVRFSSQATVNFMDNSYYWEYTGKSAEYSRIGFLVAPAVGVNWRCGNNFSMYLNVACWFQAEPYCDHMEISYIMMPYLKASIGCTF